jgi:hypothetical protein
MRKLYAVPVLAAIGVFMIGAGRAAGDPARFWISTSASLPAGPQAPDIPGLVNGLRVINIWAQPATASPGPFNPASNPFNTLQNFSLDILAEPSVVSFLTGSVVVYNPIVNGKKRYQYVHDSTAESTSPIQTQGPSLDPISGFFTAYHLDDLSGFTVNSTDSGFGGSACNPNDPYCATTDTGSPAWLVASLATRTISDSGTSNYFMQIGVRGMNHQGEPTSQTSVIFGTSNNPAYNAATDRQTTLGDSAHFTLQAQPGSAAIATHWPGGTTDWDHIAAGSAPSWLNNVTIDAGLVTVTGSKQANSTTISRGRLDLGTGASLASDVTVATGGAISGNGTIDANLTLSGSLDANSTGPLRVTGVATISGGLLSLAPGYSQTFGTSNSFVVLESDAGLQGTLSTTIGQSLGPEATLASIVYGPHTVSIQVKYTPGDFDHNNVVNAADYVLWRKGLGTTFVAADYNRWRSNFGNSIGAGTGSFIAVPEPAAFAVAVLGAIGLLGLLRIPRTKLPATADFAPLRR